MRHLGRRHQHRQGVPEVRQRGLVAEERHGAGRPAGRCSTPGPTAARRAPVYVYPVTSSWSVTGDKLARALHRALRSAGSTFATGWVPLGSTSSPCPAAWEGINLDQAGTNLVNGWTHGTAPTTGWRWARRHPTATGGRSSPPTTPPTGDPFLAVTYTTDGASYKLASSSRSSRSRPTQNGAVRGQGDQHRAPAPGRRPTGTSCPTGPTTPAGKLVANHPVFTPMPSTVAPGASGDGERDRQRAARPARTRSTSTCTRARPGPSRCRSPRRASAFAVGLYVPQPPPVVSGVYPPTGYISPTLHAAAVDDGVSATGGTISYSFTLTCEPLPGQTCPAASITLGQICDAVLDAASGRCSGTRRTRGR